MMRPKDGHFDERELFRVRVQTMLLAWAVGALLEGLVGFGYPWAFVAPILITLGIPDLDAVRVAAIANNAPGLLRCARRTYHCACRGDRI
jgi:hypothetical protein